MFALTWLNNDTLYLARDRFGEKPFYYFIENNSGYLDRGDKILFTLWVESYLLIKQIFRYLVNGYKSLYKNEKIFSGIVKAKPGSYLKFDQKYENNEIFIGSLLQK